VGGIVDVPLAWGEEKKGVPFGFHPAKLPISGESAPHTAHLSFHTAESGSWMWEPTSYFVLPASTSNFWHLASFRVNWSPAAYPINGNEIH